MQINPQKYYFFLTYANRRGIFLETALFFVDFAVFLEQKEGRYVVTPLFRRYVLRKLLRLQKGKQLRHRIEHFVSLREVFALENTRIDSIDGQARRLARTDT